MNGIRKQKKEGMDETRKEMRKCRCKKLDKRQKKKEI